MKIFDVKKIFVLGKSYKIRWQDRIDSHECLGTTYRDLQTVSLSKGWGEDSTEETLIHEVLHIIDTELMLELSEETVARIAVGLYSAGVKIR